MGDYPGLPRRAPCDPKGLYERDIGGVAVERKWWHDRHGEKRCDAGSAEGRKRPLGTGRGGERFSAKVSTGNQPSPDTLILTW